MNELYSQIYSLLATCTNSTISYEVREDIEYLQRYVPNPSPAFLQGLISKLKQYQ